MSAARTFLIWLSISEINSTGALDERPHLYPQETVQLLQQRDWPGNVRELENSIARYVVLGSEETFSGERVDRDPVHIAYEPNADGHIPLKRISQQAIRRMEHDVILRVLQANHWNRRKTAQVLKISYRALLYKVRQAGLPAKHPRPKEPSWNSVTDRAGPEAWFVRKPCPLYLSHTTPVLL